MSSVLNSTVNFFFDGVSVNIKDRKQLKKFIVSIFKSERKKLGSLNYVFSDDKSVQMINKEYLNHNTLTDIITFELSENDKPIIGEIYISVDRVRENAVNYGTSFKKELHRVIFHGALHLCGFKDKTKIQKHVMSARENHYLLNYFS